MTIAFISSRNNASVTSSFLDRSYNRSYLSLFQDKPTVVRDPSDSTGHCDRPQSVTRHLFAPLVTVQQQEQQQQRQQQQEQPQLSCRPQTATASIFAPRTEDMNKGFLTFSEDQPGLTSVYSPLRKRKSSFFRSFCEKGFADPYPYCRFFARKKKIRGRKIRKNMTHE